MMIPFPKARQQPGSFKVSYLSEALLMDGRTLEPDKLIAVVRYGTRLGPLPITCPVASVPLPGLSQETPIEVWTSTTPVAVENRNGIHYASNGQILFGVLETGEPDDVSLDALTYDVYKVILRLVEEEGYPNLLRIWNYIQDINEDQNDLERYRLFCLGRHNAFVELDPEFERTLPAASTAGTREAGMTVYFVASREPGTPFENPQQVSAYCYPPRYGPRSPSFSRAMVKHWGTQSHLFLAGTASIIGHGTQHAGDVQKQLAETLRNIQALLKHTAESEGADFQTGAVESFFKVYIRRAEDFPLVQKMLLQELGETALILYLQGDICRSDLLVEVEGIYVA